MGTYNQQTRRLEFPLTFTSTRRHCKAWNTCKMKCYIILTVIVALTVSHAEEVEIVETREKCHHTPTGPVCDKEVLKREICTNGPGSTNPGSTNPGSVGVCKKVSVDFEVVETREKCHPTPTGPICDKEVLKREMCKEGPGPLGPRCKKVEEDVHEIVETRETCRRTPTGPLCDKEVLKREICTNGPGSVGVCKKVSEDFEVVEAREKCRPTPSGPICDKEVLKREKCRGTPAGAICDKEVLKREKCRGPPAGAIRD